MKETLFAILEDLAEGRILGDPQRLLHLFVLCHDLGRICWQIFQCRECSFRLI